MDNREYWIFWQLLLPGSGRRIWDLINYFESPKIAWEASELDLAEVSFLGSQGAKKLIKRMKSLHYDKLLTYLEKLRCRVLTIDDIDYPASLKEIYDPPPAIFAMGDLQCLDKSALAIVGSRKPSPYGLAVADSFAYELATAGLTIVSGMARGVDSAAHQGTLRANGRTVAVLGCGPDVVYPKENTKLMKDIIEKGAVITEFPPGAAPEAWHFPSRNRIISGLSNGILVVEAAEKSGSLITVDFALEQGREVMAIPGNINNSKSVGTNKLIRQGACLITKPKEILEVLEIKETNYQQIDSSQVTTDITTNEARVLEILSHLPMNLEQIIDASHMSPQEAGAALTLLEINGLIRILPGNLYVAARL